MSVKTFALIFFAVLVASLLVGCGKFNPPWGGSAW